MLFRPNKILPFKNCVKLIRILSLIFKILFVKLQHDAVNALHSQLFSVQSFPFWRRQGSRLCHNQQANDFNDLHSLHYFFHYYNPVGVVHIHIVAYHH
jgi:hypothetical protein